jgi:hypothetical protein
LKFSFVPQFFTAFFAGFQYLDCDEEAVSAIENLTILQVFKTEDDEIKLCLAFEFGSGFVELNQVM